MSAPRWWYGKSTEYTGRDLKVVVMPQGLLMTAAGFIPPKHAAAVHGDHPDQLETFPGGRNKIAFYVLQADNYIYDGTNPENHRNKDAQ